MNIIKHQKFRNHIKKTYNKLHCLRQHDFTVMCNFNLFSCLFVRFWMNDQIKKRGEGGKERREEGKGRKGREGGRDGGREGERRNYQRFGLKIETKNVNRTEIYVYAFIKVITFSSVH